jgi:hypothetical protein
MAFARFGFYPYALVFYFIASPLLTLKDGIYLPCAVLDSNNFGVGEVLIEHCFDGCDRGFSRCCGGLAICPTQNAGLMGAVGLHF